MIKDEFTCPNCFTGDITVLEKKETNHLENGIFYKIIHISLVCQKGCWHSWEEFFRIKLKDFNEDEKITKIPYLTEEVINPEDVHFYKD